MGDYNFQPIFRYTSFASAIDVIKYNRLTILNPSTWPDQNDTRYLNAYKRKTGHKSLLALCLTCASETSHHWNMFASGSDGVRIVLNRHRLQQNVDQEPGTRMRDVKYVKINEVGDIGDRPEDWPFVKRHPYRGEEEVRIVWSDYDDGVAVKHVSLSSDTVTDLVLSPQIPVPLVDSIKELVKSVSANPDLRIYQSTLLSNQRWISSVEDVAWPNP